jgi:hypothetical protein
MIKKEIILIKPFYFLFKNNIMYDGINYIYCCIYCDYGLYNFNKLYTSGLKSDLLCLQCNEIVGDNPKANFDINEKYNVIENPDPFWFDGFLLYDLKPLTKNEAEKRKKSGSYLLNQQLYKIFIPDEFKLITSGIPVTFEENMNDALKQGFTIDKSGVFTNNLGNLACWAFMIKKGRSEHD